MEWLIRDPRLAEDMSLKYRRHRDFMGMLIVSISCIFSPFDLNYTSVPYFLFWLLIYLITTFNIVILSSIYCIISAATINRTKTLLSLLCDCIIIWAEQSIGRAFRICSKSHASIKANVIVNASTVLISIVIRLFVFDQWYYFTPHIYHHCFWIWGD